MLCSRLPSARSATHSFPNIPGLCGETALARVTPVLPLLRKAQRPVRPAPYLRPERAIICDGRGTSQLRTRSRLWNRGKARERSAPLSAEFWVSSPFKRDTGWAFLRTDRIFPRARFIKSVFHKPPERSRYRSPGSPASKLVESGSHAAFQSSQLSQPIYETRSTRCSNTFNSRVQLKSRIPHSCRPTRSKERWVCSRPGSPRHIVAVCPQTRPPPSRSTPHTLRIGTPR